MTDAAVVQNEPVLRTLAPALRELERQLRAWLDTRRRYPLTTLQRATLEGLTHDLERQAVTMQMDQPLLVIMLMGGTGVGKSTLLNALAGGQVAQASFTRPTTRDPVVYYHRSIQPERLDPALRHCKLIAHDRPELAQKILVDTPDLDSNDIANRETLIALLPVADVVLYVGSQEKYHDQIGWELFLQQRQRRAFAFVLNKWDRCLYAGAGGMRPDDDLLRGLRSEGFEQPLLFRTCAQHWVDHPPHANGQAAPPVEGEQYLELVRWLEAGLTRLEIEAIKAHGVSQLLHQLLHAMEVVCPPDLAAVAGRVQSAWERLLGDEAEAVASVLINTLEPYQKEIEHHFAQQRQHKFSGLMSIYLQGFNRLRYAGSTLRDQIPLLKATTAAVEKPPSWDLESFARACSSAASAQHLESRLKALTNKLLVESDSHGLPLPLVTGPAEERLNHDWRGRYAQVMYEVIVQIEKAWSQPQGARAVLQKIVIQLANWLPVLSFMAMVTLLLWQFTMEQRPFQWGDLFLPVVVTGLVLILLHVGIGLLFPFRWSAIRGDVESSLRGRLRDELVQQYGPIPGEIAREVLAERRQVELFVKEVREVTAWLEQREQAASVLNLYGK